MSFRFANILFAVGVIISLVSAAFADERLELIRDLDGLRLKWKGEAGRYYVIENSSDLKNWSLYKHRGFGGILEGAEPLQAGESWRFVRLREQGLLELLSGEWQGTRDTVQAGSCSIGGDSIRTENVRVQISGASMDDFEVVARGLDYPYIPSYLRGSLNGDGTMNLIRTSSSTCNGVRETGKQYSYSGEIEVVGNEIRAKLEAREAWCADMNCVFDVIIEFSRVYDID